MLRRDARVIQTEKGGIHMAKKAAKGAKKKASKKKERRDTKGAAHAALF
jgi:hypothetical protein